MRMKLSGVILGPLAMLHSEQEPTQFLTLAV